MLRADARNRDHLPTSHDNLSSCLGNLGRREEALHACNEAVSFLLPLAERFPDAFGLWLRSMAANSLRCQRTGGRPPHEDTLQRLSPFLGSEDDSEG